MADPHPMGCPAGRELALDRSIRESVFAVAGIQPESSHFFLHYPRRSIRPGQHRLCPVVAVDTFRL